MKSTNSAYNRSQTTFLLSVFSNVGSDLRGPVGEIEQELSNRIAEALKNAEPNIGQWDVVWGPAVYQATSFGSNTADNVMYVASRAKVSEESRDLVVGIAGSNSGSAFDWLIENLYVNQQVPWQYGNPAPQLRPMIAAGTDVGLKILQQMTPGPNLPGAGLTLGEFVFRLKDLPGDSKISIAGHSLGGALSPVMALWLFDTQEVWDPRHKARLFCLPSAGPSPGNFDFAFYYENSMLGRRTERIHNTLDVVSKAWATDDLEELPTLYDPLIPENGGIDLLAFLLIEQSRSGNYTQFYTREGTLPGVVNEQLIGPSDSAFLNYVRQLGYQHGEAYFKMLGLMPESEQFKSLIPAFDVTRAEEIAADLEKKLERKRQIRVARLANAVR
jgi:hypothetical protein